ncbi:hypothetical protein OS493_004930 [Desmophyllum pertusum]|uniref:CTHRC1 C-terminal domain-containing protein n=1 Tax=Desmophyllum pertusum TaxID=174260 RepID=A0A9X0CSN7_9CNID|nr:hypothetical protein OS493_004930 [Desmophyllum pertusum]
MWYPRDPRNPRESRLTRTEGKGWTTGTRGTRRSRGRTGSHRIPQGYQTGNSVLRETLNSNLDSGNIYGCKFVKKEDISHLRVVYQGNTRVWTAYKCKRWFFTFNGVECSIPIDTAVYHWPRENIIRTTTIEGYCSGISKGPVTVALNVGACASHSAGVVDAYTGWNSVSRIIVQEVQPPQQ